MDPEEQEPIEIALVLTGLHDVPIAFVNWMSVNHQGSEFVLTFGQYSPPIVLGNEEQRREQVRKMGPVPIKVVARLGIPANRMIDIVRALSENLSKYEQQKGLAE